MQIIKVENDASLQALTNQEFEAYEEPYKISYHKEPFCFIAKEGEEIAGSISGHSFYKEVHISELIVFEKYRGNDIGSALIQWVEDYFKEKDIDHIHLCTYAFQAPAFYQKQGYTLEYIRKNRKDARLDKYHFVKYLD